MVYGNTLCRVASLRIDDTDMFMEQEEDGQVDSGFRPKNALTVDVEDYFQVSAFEGCVPRSEWDKFPCRVEKNVHRILQLFDEHDACATFFVLGWVAERYPDLIRHISSAGHEIASHGFEHIRVSSQTKSLFREDVSRTRKLLEDICATKVSGYRAASFSIGASNLWALDVLQEVGYTYSSSIYPVHHDLYGMPNAPQVPFRLNETGLLEIPISTISIAGRRWPSGGGGFFRLFPYGLSKWAISRINQAKGTSAIFYFHPWEIDAGQPRIAGASVKSRFRHYLNLRRTEARLVRLMGDFEWDRIDKVYRDILSGATVEIYE